MFENKNQKKVIAADKIMKIFKQSDVTFNESMKILNYVKFMLGERRPQL